MQSVDCISAGVDPGIQLRGAMASASCEPITGVWGQNPSGVQGQNPWSGVQGGDSSRCIHSVVWQ